MASARANRIKDSSSDRLFLFLDWSLLIILVVVITIPLLNVVSSSLSAPSAVGAGKVFLLPKGFNIDAYKALTKEKQILTGFGNTLIYAIAGTCLNVVMTVMCAYPLSRRELVGKKGIMFYFTFTMLFSGGMMPTYLLIKSLGLTNTRWVMILPGAMTVYNMIIARTFFMNTIPQEMNEAAEIDGASDMRLIFSIVLPLSAPILAVLTLFYAVGHWNAFFDCFLYITDPKLFNLQVVLRNFIANIKAMMDSSGITDSIAAQQDVALFQEVLKYAIIVFTSIPILVVYPFVQKYFVKGVMIGSLKG
ncbi:carbohydrate ABC transporter permease [Ruminococcaceae bacterium OttesenSCG-928-L11]|nr:carbohydrate ABC transporter permease [Ruminococcaceae bacterium OttesenSCG-928-L11]